MPHAIGDQHRAFNSSVLKALLTSVLKALLTYFRFRM